MTTQVMIAPQNSVLLAMDPDSGEIPESMDGKTVASTPSCIAVGTRSAADGETLVVLTDERHVVSRERGLSRIFCGRLATPRKEVGVCTVLLEAVLKLTVRTDQTSVEIWADHESEPSRVYLVLDA